MGAEVVERVSVATRERDGVTGMDRLGQCRLCGRRNIYEFARLCPRCKVERPVSLPPQELPPPHPVTKMLVIGYYAVCTIIAIAWLTQCAGS